MLASIQAPSILMSQHRHAEKDRLNAGHDYDVNLQAEREIMLSHEKTDLPTNDPWNPLLMTQHEQLDLIKDLIAKQPNAEHNSR